MRDGGSKIQRHSGLCWIRRPFMERLKTEGVTLVFLALHGSFGEDGTVQRLLDHEGILYTAAASRPVK